MELSRPIRKLLFSDLCKVISQNAEAPKLTIELREMLLEYDLPNNNGLEFDSYKPNKNIQNGRSGSLSKVQADKIWKAILNEVLPALCNCKTDSKVNELFAPDQHSLVDMVEATVNVVDYFTYGYTPGIGTNSRGKYEAEEKTYPSFNKDDLAILNQALIKVEKKLKTSTKEPPVEILKLLYAIGIRINKIERHVELNRSRRQYAQSSLLILSYFTNLTTGQLTKAIFSDLERFGVVPKVIPKHFVRQALAFETKISKIIPKSNRYRRLNFLLSMNLKKEKNKSVFLSKYAILDDSEMFYYSAEKPTSQSDNDLINLFKKLRKSPQSNG